MAHKFSEKEQGQVLEILRKAAMDEGYRRLCLTDPAKAAAKGGLTIPKGKNVRFVEPDDIIVQLTEPVSASEDLTAEELEQVAGGWTVGCRKTRIDCPGSVVISQV